jgi:hypothetical protein
MGKEFEKAVFSNLYQYISNRAENRKENYSVADLEKVSNVPQIRNPAV